MYPRETGSEGVDGIHLAWDRDQHRDFLNRIMKLRVPPNARDFWTSRVTISSSRRTASWCMFLPSCLTVALQGHAVFDITTHYPLKCSPGSSERSLEYINFIYFHLIFARYKTIFHSD